MRAISVVSNIAGKQTNLPILSNILIRADQSKVEFATTNLEMGISTTLRAKVEQEGSFTVPAKLISDYIALTNNEQISLERIDNELQIASDDASTKIKGVDAEEFPVIPSVEEGKEYGLLIDPFRESLSKVVFAAAKNEIRPELSGISFQFFGNRYKGLVLASTDSYRLAEKKMSVTSGTDQVACIIPAKAVQEMNRLLSAMKDGGVSEVKVIIGQAQVAMVCGDVTLVSRLIDGTYPDYAQIIPEELKTTATIPKDRFTKSIKAASLFASDGVHAVSLSVHADQQVVTLSSASAQTGEHVAHVDGAVTGEDNDIVLNYKYVLEGMQHMDGEIAFQVNSGEAPSLLRAPHDDSYLYIVMPIRQ